MCFRSATRVSMPLPLGRRCAGIASGGLGLVFEVSGPPGVAPGVVCSRAVCQFATAVCHARRWCGNSIAYRCPLIGRRSRTSSWMPWELLPHLIEAADYGPVVVAAISFALEHVDEQVSLLAHGFGRRSGAECTQWE